MQRHPTGVGISVDNDGRLLNANGISVLNLYAVGAMCAGANFMKNGVVGANMVNIPGMRGEIEAAARGLMQDLMYKRILSQPGGGQISALSQASGQLHIPFSFAR